MKYENACPVCGTVRVMRQKTTRVCQHCARILVWESRRLAALHDLIHRTRALVSVFQGMRSHAAGAGIYTTALDDLERDVAQLANDVMIAQLAIAEKGVAA